MDSFTQVALGAPVGEAVLGKKAGNKVVLWGGIIALIPDLDIAAIPFLDPVEQLTFHRSITHSITFSFASAVFFAFLLHRLYRNGNATKWDWAKVAFLSHSTHILLDTFTVYGTQIFQPFSDYGVAFNSIFIIDPAYSLPLMLSVIILVWYPKHSVKRRIVTYLGLGISTAYICLTLINKSYMNGVFEESLKKQSIPYSQFMTNPAPFQNVLWTCVVDGMDRYWIGYYSLFDANNDITFQPVEKNHHLIKDFQCHPIIERLIFVSNDYYCIRQESDSLYFIDLRFGSFGGWINGKSRFPFEYKIFKAGDTLSIQRIHPSIGPATEALQELIKRIKGI